MHATAIGKLLLAHLPSRTRKRIIEAAPLSRFMDHTITDEADLELELKAFDATGSLPTIPRMSGSDRRRRSHLR